MSACVVCECDRLSLEAAVRDKYCSCADGGEDGGQLPAHKTIKESAIALRPGEVRVAAGTSRVGSRVAFRYAV